MHVACARFAEEIADACARSEDERVREMCVYTYDESLTSKEAAERVSAVGGDSTAHLDAESAAILLERYFSGAYGEAKVVVPFGKSRV
jgi:putative Holliday junction resolvase